MGYLALPKSENLKKEGHENPKGKRQKNEWGGS